MSAPELNLLLNNLTECFSAGVEYKSVADLNMDRLLRLGGGMPGLGQVNDEIKTNKSWN